MAFNHPISSRIFFNLLDILPEAVVTCWCWGISILLGSFDEPFCLDGVPLLTPWPPDPWGRLRVSGVDDPEDPGMDSSSVPAGGPEFDIILERKGFELKMNEDTVLTVGGPMKYNT